MAVGVGPAASGDFDSAATTLLGSSNLGGSNAISGLESGAILGLDTTNADGGAFTCYATLADPNERQYLGPCQAGQRHADASR